MSRELLQIKENNDHEEVSISVSMKTGISPDFILMNGVPLRNQVGTTATNATKSTTWSPFIHLPNSAKLTFLLPIDSKEWDNKGKLKVKGKAIDRCNCFDFELVKVEAEAVENVEDDDETQVSERSE